MQILFRWPRSPRQPAFFCLLAWSCLAFKPKRTSKAIRVCKPLKYPMYRKTLYSATVSRSTILYYPASSPEVYTPSTGSNGFLSIANKLACAPTTTQLAPTSHSTGRQLYQIGGIPVEIGLAKKKSGTEMTSNPVVREIKEMTNQYTTVMSSRLWDQDEDCFR